MIVYHGSNQIIKNPDISFSKQYLDFGKGFYVTSYQKQAERWAAGKSSRYGGNSTVNVYELKDNLCEYNILQFNDENEKWLDFVCAC